MDFPCGLVHQASIGLLRGARFQPRLIRRGMRHRGQAPTFPLHPGVSSFPRLAHRARPAIIRAKLCIPHSVPPSQSSRLPHAPAVRPKTGACIPSTGKKICIRRIPGRQAPPRLRMRPPPRLAYLRRIPRLFPRRPPRRRPAINDRFSQSRPNFCPARRSRQGNCFNASPLIEK